MASALLACSLFVLFVVLPGNVRANILYVGGTGPGNYTTIQAAVDAANPGDTVFVYGGFYHERVVVTKSLSLEGENRSSTSIFWNVTGPAVNVRADWVNITGFNIDNFVRGDVGVLVGPFQNCYIANSIISSNQGWGVAVGYSANITVANNMFGGGVGGILVYQSADVFVHGNMLDYGGVGVHILQSNNITLANNTVTWYYQYGILLNQSRDNTLSGNILFTTGHVLPRGDGITLYGDLLEHWNTHDIDTSNTVNGRPVQYWKDAVGGTVPAGAGEVILANTTGVIVENQNLSDGDVGIELGFSSGNFLRGNTISASNIAGVQLYYSPGNAISNNNLSSGVANGIEIYESGGNIISNNTMNNNKGLGAYLTLSDDNVFHNNSFIGNQRAGLYGTAANRTVVSDNNMSSNGEQGIVLLRTEHSTLSNNTVSSNSYPRFHDTGILVVGGDNSIINNTVSRNYVDGITVIGRGGLVKSNIIDQNGGMGIKISAANRITASDNVVSMNGRSSYEGSGITLYESAGITVINNTMSGNGVILYGDDAAHWYNHVIDTSNSVNGKPLYYWKNATGGTIPPGAGQVIIASSVGVVLEGQNVSDASIEIQVGFSTGCMIANNTVWKGRHGIFIQSSNQNSIVGNSVHSATSIGAYMVSSSGNTVSRNNISGNDDGMAFVHSGDNSITDNTLSFNGGEGVGFGRNSNYNIIANNTMQGNRQGLGTYGSNGNKAYHNNFINNQFQAYNNGTNTWDNGYPSGGNYWSDYTGPDNYSGPNQNLPGRDGIGDVPYPIPGDPVQDRYPLRTPVGLPSPDLDISPSNISFNFIPPITQGSTVLVNASIRNVGTAPSGPTVVRLYDGLPPSVQIGPDQPLAPLAVGASANVSVLWTPLVAGNHEICVVVDPENLVLETKETNNAACKSIIVDFSRQLAPGHRFMSFPLTVANRSIESVLSSIPGCYEYVH